MIHALPGMGADRRMYPSPWETLSDFRAHDWVRHHGEKSLAEVAQSMCTARGIQDGDILIGSSLGGMVACEITKIRTIPRLYLVGSATRKEEVSRLLAALHPLARVAPLDWLRLSAGSIPIELAQMFTTIEASFVRAMCSAIFEWEGLGTTATRVFRIHGRRDLLIPPPEEVHLLLDGGHLISVSHAKDCAEFIGANESMQQTGGSRSAQTA